MSLDAGNVVALLAPRAEPGNALAMAEEGVPPGKEAPFGPGDP